MNEEHEEQMTNAEIENPVRPDRDQGVRRFDSETSRMAESDAARTAMADGEARRTATPLFPAEQSEQFRARWIAIQSSFVDEPRRAIQQADSLIAEVMKTLTDSFASERRQLDEQWDRRGEREVSTEDMRVGFQRYRSFFDRLLSI